MIPGFTNEYSRSGCHAKTVLSASVKPPCPTKALMLYNEDVCQQLDTSYDGPVDSAMPNDWVIQESTEAGLILKRLRTSSLYSRRGSQLRDFNRRRLCGTGQLGSWICDRQDSAHHSGRASCSHTGT